MKNSPHNREHLKHKALQEANAMKDSGPLPEDMIINKDFKKQFDAKRSELPHKESHQHKQTSKRTGPGEVKNATEPSHIHTENEHWNHVVQAQNNERTKIFNKKQQKKKY